mgnify:CR=1 FL=1
MSKNYITLFFVLLSTNFFAQENEVKVDFTTQKFIGEESELNRAKYFAIHDSYTSWDLASDGEGGYAAELTDEQKAKQAELVSNHITKQDIVITTALIPGRPAPRLISDAQIASMKAGSVIVDLAAEQGGNVEGAVSGETVVKHGVKIIGAKNMPATMAADSSALFARNHYNFLSAFWDEESGKPVLDEEIGDAIRLTKDGAVVNERLLAN